MEEQNVGTIFTLEDLNPGTEFTFPDGGKITLRLCAGDDLKEIKKQTTKNKIEYKNGTRIPYTVTDENLENRLLWDFCIVGWENLFSDAEKTKLIPCTTENKILLMGKSIKFSRFVSDCLEQLASIEKDEAEQIEKN